MKTIKLMIPFLLFVALMTISYSLAFARNGTPVITSVENRDGRLQYASDLRSFLTKIDSQIPSLSPSQKDWLKKEKSEYEKTMNPRRFVEVAKTKEYNIDFVKSNLAIMTHYLNLIAIV